MVDEAENGVETGAETQVDADAGEQDKGTVDRGADGKFAKKGDDKPALEVADWREGLPDDLRKTADKFNSREEALKAYKQAEARISRSIVRPGKDATEEERTAFQTALRREMGIPESLDDYKVDIPTAFAEDEQAMEGIRALLGEFHKLGVPASAAGYAIGIHEKLMQAQAAAMVEEARQAMADAEVELRREWGADHDANEAIASGALARYADDAFIALQKMTGKELAAALGNKRLGDLAPLKRLFARVGRDTGESRTIFQQTQGGRDLADEIKRLRATDEYKRGDKTMQNRVSELYQRLYGNEPAAA